MGDAGAYGPAARRRVLAALARERMLAAAAAPRRTGDLVADLAAADEAVAALQAAWDVADREWVAARAAAGPLPGVDAAERVLAAEAERAELWALRCAAVRHRDRLADLFAAEVDAPLSSRDGWARP